MPIAATVGGHWSLKGGLGYLGDPASKGRTSGLPIGPLEQTLNSGQ